MKYKGRYKICRQFGFNFWDDKSKQIIKTKHKKLYNRKSLFYKTMVFNKLLRYYYGNLTKQKFKFLLKNIKKLSNSNLQTPLVFEQYLHMVIYRLHWVSSIFEAKQKIRYGYFLVNGKTVYSSYYILNKNDVIQVKSTKIKYILKGIENHILYNLELKKYIYSLLNTKNIKNFKFLTYNPLKLNYYLNLEKSRFNFNLNFSKSEKEKYKLFVKFNNLFRLGSKLQNKREIVYFDQKFYLYVYQSKKHIFNITKLLKSYKMRFKFLYIPKYLETNFSNFTAIVICNPSVVDFSTPIPKGTNYVKKYRNMLR